MPIAEQDIAGSKATPLTLTHRMARLTSWFGLSVRRPHDLTIRRLKRGTGYSFVNRNGRAIKDATTLARLKSFAVPLAYSDVRYAQKPDAHLQAVGREAAGRLQIAGVRISLKDFRTLMASAAVMESLARVTPAAGAHARNRQIMEAVKASAEELANTPTICRKSSVHETVVSAFEDGLLERFSSRPKRSRSQASREQVLLQVITLAAGGK
jgi:DNA topoisomerase IB